MLGFDDPEIVILVLVMPGFSMVPVHPVPKPFIEYVNLALGVEISAVAKGIVIGNPITSTFTVGLGEGPTVLLKAVDVAVDVAIAIQASVVVTPNIASSAPEPGQDAVIERVWFFVVSVTVKAGVIAVNVALVAEFGVIGFVKSAVLYTPTTLLTPFNCPVQTWVALSGAAKADSVVAKLASNRVDNKIWIFIPFAPLWVMGYIYQRARVLPFGIMLVIKG